MLVEDHMTMLWGLERLIEAEAPKMEVVGTARTGEQALAMVMRHLPDIVLLDLDLNGISTISLIPVLQANGVSRVLVLTAERNAERLDHAARHGAKGVMQKDVPAEQVIKAIEKVHQGELWLGREMLARAFSQLTSPEKTTKLIKIQDKHANLTAKELKVLQAVVAGNGASNKTLAQTLYISEHTMRNHLTSIYHKLGVNNRLELYVYAVRHHLADAAYKEDQSNSQKQQKGGPVGEDSYKK